MSGRTEWSGSGCVSHLAGCCALPAPSPLKTTMLSYSSLLPLLAGWRCLSAMLFSVLAPTGQYPNLPERQKPRKILSKQLPVALPGHLSLGWPGPSRGKVVLGCEHVPKSWALLSHLELITSWMSPRIAPCGWPCPPCQPHTLHTAGGGQPCHSQRWEEGLNNCCLSVCLPFL